MEEEFMSKKQWKESIEKFFMTFILLQPLLDISAYFGLPVSEVVRMAALGIGGIYLLFFTKLNKKVVLYFSLLGGYTIIHLLVNFFMKEPYSLIDEMIYVVKTLYFVIVLFVYIKVFQSFQKHPKWKNIVFRNVAISITMIVIVLGIAEITDTGKRSYDMLAKSGHTGWFFSGNELSAIMAMGVAFFTYQIIYLSSKNKLWQWLSIIPLLLTSWAMMTIGTKVGFGSLIIITVVMLGYLVFRSIQQNKIHFQLTTWIIVVIGIIVFTPITAIGQNLNINYPDNVNVPSTLVKKTNKVKANEEIVPVRVLSGREDFLNEAINQYKEAPIAQKVFGMGMGGNYKQEAKLVEMDFFDLFFNFGVIGFLLLLAPVIYFMWNTLKNIYHTKKITFEFTLIIISIGIGLGTAFVAGHVLSSPAASFYLALAIAFCSVISLQWRSRGYI